MSGGGGGGLANGGGLEALLEAAKFVEEQEKQKLRNQPVVVEEPPQEKEVLTTQALTNGSHCAVPTRTSPPPPTLPPPPPPLPPPPPRQGSGTREVHNKLEKNRRAHLKECFELLKKQVPAAADEKKTSNLSILHSAIRYIQVLRRKEREFEHEMERLAREKIAYQQKLATLKKELAAQWEHIDFNTLLPETVEPEPRKSSGSRIVVDSDGEEMSTSQARGGTLYSSASSLSSASPLQTDVSHTIPHHLQVVNPPGPPSLLVSPIQLLPPTTLRMLPADTQIVHPHIPPTGITIPNGVLSHGSMALTTKHSSSTESNPMMSPGITHVVNHSLVVSQPSPLLLAAPSQLGSKVVTTPILKSVGQMPIVNTHQFLMKPTMVVVSTPSNTPK